ncbi:hypothetical protein F4779DRAFT_629971 [Xylariaceae sp. FL0662B]|nr:hypothetical protein F4779DRAFT_632516 [Xylariaceae sp. FL0662B]KAI0005814.1 hypothetical protein F4779DRAFT_629971 [Xylariaceae sp. FL0662B]
MANTPAPPSNALVLYNPQDFDTVMTNGSDLVLSGISVEDPPEWVIELHTKMQESHHALVTLARTVKKDQLQSLAIREQYATMCATYQAMTNMYRIHMQVSDEQITLFKRQIEEASSNFSQQVWSTVAKFSQDNKEKARAIDKLQEVANHHHRALEVLQRELQQQQTFQHNVSNWAMEKDLQINDLLAREFVNPEQMNEHTRRQIDDLRAYTQAALAEFQQQSTANQGIDVDTVLQNIGRRAASRPLSSSPFISRPPTEATRQPPSKYSSSEARMRNVLSNQALQTAQARRTANNARMQFDSARAGPFMSGGNGNGGSLPPRQGPGDPGSDPDDSDNDEERLLRVLERIGRPAPATINPVQLQKPASYDGEDKAKFRPWWLKVEAYIQTYAESFPEDYHRINWTWHQQRLTQVRKMGLTDRWEGYKTALAERFKDPAERHRNSKAMQKLAYKGDTTQYLTELLDLNEVVQWSGTTFQNHISKVLPDEITKLVYSRQGGLPDTDEEFLTAIQEAGQIYENMLTNPGISSGKEGPVSTTEHSKSGQQNQGKDNGSTSGQNRSSKKPKKDQAKPGGKPTLDPKDKKWTNVTAALKGVEQSDIDQFKKVNKSCWRCGRDNHHTLACFAKANVNGKSLPAPPDKVSSAKRKADDEPTVPSEQKKLKIDAALRETEQPRLVTELDDSDSDF